MICWYATVTDLKAQAEVLRRRRYGIVETAGGELVRIILRPFPKLISWPGILFDEGFWHRHSGGDRCWLYYNQPLRFSNFLAIKHIVSLRGTSFATFRVAVAVMDEIARIKRSDALLCDAANRRISDRLLRRWGWEPHAQAWLHRNYIKRFYGSYPHNTKALTNGAGAPVAPQVSPCAGSSL
jgi:hypothetical protein